MIFSVTSGKAKNARSNSTVLSARRRPLKVAASSGPVAVGLQDAQLDVLLRRQHPEMVAHRHLDEGRDVEQFVLALPHAGIADVSRLHRQHVRMDLAKRVAHFVDDERELAAGAIAEIDRQRIEGIAEQAGIAEQQHPPAGEIDAALGRATLARRCATMIRRGRRDRLP